MTRKFLPKIFKVKTFDQSGNMFTWDLLTVDGETPDSTLYFMLKDDSPSNNHDSQIAEAIENGKWEELDYYYVDYDISDFNISSNDFEGSGDAYTEIVEELKRIL